MSWPLAIDVTQAQAAQATDTRDVIISAAFACFRTQGLRKTTIVDIAKRGRRLP